MADEDLSDTPIYDGLVAELSGMDSPPPAGRLDGDLDLDDDIEEAR